MLRGLEAPGQVADRTTADADAAELGGVRFLRLDLVGGTAGHLETTATGKSCRSVALQAVFTLRVAGIHLRKRTRNVLVPLF